jgi:hypothetical protein
MERYTTETLERMGYAFLMIQQAVASKGKTNKFNQNFVALHFTLMVKINMNTFEQVMQLKNKLHQVVQDNKGTITLHFYDGDKVQVYFKNARAGFGNGQPPYGEITVFTTDINNTTTYSLFDIQDIS